MLMRNTKGQLSSIKILAVIASAILPGALSAQVVQKHGEVITTEDEFPKNVTRKVTGKCGRTNFEFEIVVGRSTVGASLIRATVDGHSRIADLRSALAKLPTGSLGILDITIDRCLEERARIQVDVVQNGPPPNVRHHFIWIGRAGDIVIRE